MDSLNTAGRYWADATTRELESLDPERTVVVLPVAAIEQHGPHLPLATDAIVADALVRHAVATPRPVARVLALPPLVVGHSLEHAGFAGTLSASAETLLALWGDVARGVARTGARKLVLLNAHGGQRSIVDLVAVRARAEHGLLVVRANYFAFGVPDGLFAADELELGLHGGEVETSLLLHLRPDLCLLFELLTDFDEGLQEWRYRHIKLVERTIGSKHGTGGSLGAEFLKRSLFRPIFPALWAIRHRL